jgi:hypothetical protein
VEPLAELCFLRPQVVLVTVPVDWLRESWERLMHANGDMIMANFRFNK